MSIPLSSSIQVELVESSITIGGDASKNSLKFRLSNSGASPEIVHLTLKIPFGAMEADLLSSKDEEPNSEELVIRPDSSNQQPYIVFATEDWGVEIARGKPFEFELTDFAVGNPPGEAMLILESGKNSCEIPVEKPAAVGDAPKIHYFTATIELPGKKLASADYILYAGQTPVTFGIYATGYKEVTLFRNNQPLQTWTGDEAAKELSWPPAMPPDIAPIDGLSVKETPSITSVYRLDATYDDPTKKPDSLPRTVHVIAPGWNRIALPQGTPLLLVKGHDLLKGKHERLYGIFRDSKGKSALYSSATGVDDWTLEKGEVPLDMAESSGVFYKNKLWLIGGSSIDSNNVSNQIWSYGKHQDESTVGWKRRENEEKKLIGPLFPERMGQTCIVIDDAIWVMGGYNNGKKYQDVWKLEEKDGKLQSKGPKKCQWPGRLNPAVATFRNYDENCEVWIYGGSLEPYGTARSDLWSTVAGAKKWDQKKVPPSPGQPIGCTFVTFPRPAKHEFPEPERVFLIGTFREPGAKKGPAPRISSWIFEWHHAMQVWEVQPVFRGWETFQGNNFYMQAVAFNRFIFVWSLTEGIESTVKLNVLVSP